MTTPASHPNRPGDSQAGRDEAPPADQSRKPPDRPGDDAEAARSGDPSASEQVVGQPAPDIAEAEGIIAKAEKSGGLEPEEAARLRRILDSTTGSRNTAAELTRRIGQLTRELKGSGGESSDEEAA